MLNLGLLRKCKISKYIDNVVITRYEKILIDYLITNFDKSEITYFVSDYTFYCFNEQKNFVFTYYPDFINNKTIIGIDSEVLKNLYSYMLDIINEKSDENIDLNLYDTKSFLLEYINDLLDSKSLEYSTITHLSKTNIGSDIKYNYHKMTKL